MNDYLEGFEPPNMEADTEAMFGEFDFLAPEPSRFVRQEVTRLEGELEQRQLTDAIEVLLTHRRGLAERPATLERLIKKLALVLSGAERTLDDRARKYLTAVGAELGYYERAVYAERHVGTTPLDRIHLRRTAADHRALCGALLLTEPMPVARGSLVGNDFLCSACRSEAEGGRFPELEEQEPVQVMRMEEKEALLTECERAAVEALVAFDDGDAEQALRGAVEKAVCEHLAAMASERLSALSEDKRFRRLFTVPPHPAGTTDLLRHDTLGKLIIEHYGESPPWPDGSALLDSLIAAGEDEAASRFRTELVARVWPATIPPLLAAVDEGQLGYPGARQQVEANHPQLLA